jgi:hypothetical protein
MPVFVRGYVVCEGCGKSVSVRGQVSARGGSDFELWWQNLPEGWAIHHRGRSYALAYCSSRCNKHSAVMGSPDFTGKTKVPDDKFDARTVDKIFEMLETSSAGAAGADVILAAIEAVLMAWRQKGQPT